MLPSTTPATSASISSRDSRPPSRLRTIRSTMRISGSIPARPCRVLRGGWGRYLQREVHADRRPLHGAAADHTQSHTPASMTAHPAPDPLAPEAATRLTEFARACKAAARAVTLYPEGHPAIVGALARLVDVAGRAAAGGPLAVGVLPDGLHIDGRVPQRPDAA